LDKVEIRPSSSLKGEFFPPSDKSISHRAVILSSIAEGKSVVKNFLRADDTESTANAFRSLGIEIRQSGSTLTIHGKGLRGLSEPEGVIDCGNSGTTIRLISGVLSGNPFFSVLTGDDSLRKRPMARVIRPLSLMGAHIMARSDNRYPPLAIKGGGLKPVSYELPVASAQVKSSILLAALYCDGETVITEPSKSRDHTERMLPAQGADLRTRKRTVFIKGGRRLSPMEMEVPGDFSSAAFFIVAALLIPGAEITARNVGINPTRTGLLEALSRMGAKVSVENVRQISGEPVADIHCAGGTGLRAIDLPEEMIPSLIDEFPVLCVAAANAEGFTTIRGAAELRVKESDRIKAMASELKKLGAEVEEYPDGIGIKGAAQLKGTEVESHGDHRIAMAMAVAALAAKGPTTINGASAVGISFPEFFDILKRLSS
jgi:3-phosphoshikimate 1-carboxyvinyltransferase